MIVGSLCKGPAITVRPDEDLVTVARRMREQHVGLVVVATPRVDVGEEPVGVLTDRDIVVAVVAGGADPQTLRAADVMKRDPAVIGDSTSIEELLHRMRELGVRRMPVVEASGRLVGLVSLDDVIERFATTLLDVAGAIGNSRRIERAVRP